MPYALKDNTMGYYLWPSCYLCARFLGPNFMPASFETRGEASKKAQEIYIYEGRLVRVVDYPTVVEKQISLQDIATSGKASG